MNGLSRIRDGGPSRIAVGALPSVAARVLPLASQKFASLLPDATLYFEDGPHVFLMDRLRRGALDLVVGRMGPPASMKGVSFVQLYSETVAFVVRPDHPLAGTARLSDLQHWPVIFPSEGSAIRPLVDRLLTAEGLSGSLTRLKRYPAHSGGNWCDPATRSGSYPRASWPQIYRQVSYAVCPLTRG